MEEVGIDAERRLAPLVAGDRDLVRLGEFQQPGAAGQLPFPPWRDDLDVGFERVIAIAELVTASSYFGFVAFFLLAFGITFELPLVLTFLAKVELLTIETLKKKRAAAHIGMWVAAAVLVPGADPYTPVILGAAMSILYEISIIFIGIVVK